jgi:hypothetical protein
MLWSRQLPAAFDNAFFLFVHDRGLFDAVARISAFVAD